jgi:hypothetical protein
MEEKNVKISSNKCCSRGISQSDCSIHNKLNYIMICAVITQLSNVKVFYRPNKYIIDCLTTVYYREEKNVKISSNLAKVNDNSYAIYLYRQI